MRKKGDRIVDGKVVSAQEIEKMKDQGIVGVMENPKPEPATVIEEQVKGVDLSSALKPEEDYANEHTIILKIKNTGAPQVTMTGYWDGRLLSAAMRSIERKYDEVRKHAAVWAMRKAQENVA